MEEDSKLYQPPSRAAGSSNWRKKDDSPRIEPQPRTQQRRGQDGAPPTEQTASSRLYVGNLLYTAQSADVEAFFTENGFPNAKISMSTDSFTGRNPSYCFVDLEDPETAKRAMGELNGKEILGRPSRINPGNAKKSFGSNETRYSSYDREAGPARKEWQSGGQRNNEYKSTFDRGGWGRNDASNSSKGQIEQGPRLYVGGLPQIESQNAVNAEIQALFEGFEITKVGKILSPHPSKASEPGNHHYLFVDLSSAEQADAAIEALNGMQTQWGGQLRVSHARSEPRKSPVYRELSQTATS